MAAAGAYLFSITAAALICSIAAKLVHKGLTGSVIKLMAGVFMALTVVSPLVKIRLGNLEDLTIDFQVDAQALTEEGENSARESMAQIISEQTTAYILDKAESLGASLSVTVSLSDDPYPVPTAVQLKGSVSPYARKELNGYISENLGIEAEAIEWKS